MHDLKRANCYVVHMIFVRSGSKKTYRFRHPPCRLLKPTDFRAIIPPLLSLVSGFLAKARAGHTAADYAEEAAE